jgi:MFS transporter, LPLT family, lysophospholipid transporter
MNAGFYIILAAQFLSALADNALLFGAIEMLRQYNSPPEYTPLLGMYFVFSYVFLAPFVGAFADALPKGRVMFISNTIKLVGCIAMLLGLHPLLAYGIVGLGAAAYSPAKYGILTEYLPPDKLVAANSWMEGLTVLSIILGSVLGGRLTNRGLTSYRFVADRIAESGIPHALTSAEFAIGALALLYVAAAVVNLYIPKVDIDHEPPTRNPIGLVRDFWDCFRRLWRDPLGQVSLTVTTLFWGASATLRLIVLAWAASALGFTLEQATYLFVCVAVGIAIGSGMAAVGVKLEQSLKVLPVGIAMGFVTIAMVFVHSPPFAVVVLALAGLMGGYFVVPMNALLQHRGHLLMGAGHSIAVQNFNENISIFVMLGIYKMMVKAQVPIDATIVVFGLFISFVMGIVYARHRNDRME